MLPSEYVVYEELKDEVKVQIATPTPDVTNYTIPVTATDTVVSNFLINAVKTQDDSIRQVMNITAIILGIYVTLVANNYEKISIAINSSMIGNALELPFNFTRFQNMVTIFLLSIPTTCWLACLVFAVNALHPTSLHYRANRKIWEHESVNVPENNSMNEFLIKLADEKHKLFRAVTIGMLFGVLVLLYGSLVIGAK